MAVIKRITELWDAIPYNLVGKYQCCEGMGYRHLLCEKITYTESQHSTLLQNIANYLPNYMVSHPRRV